MVEHVPDQFLMKQVEKELKRCPKSIAVLSLNLSRSPAEIRQALSDLTFYGKVEVHQGGHCYQLTQGGPVPPEAA